MNLQMALQILDLKEGCSLDDVKTAYRRKAMTVHPDKGGNAKDFHAIKDAYDWLNKYGTKQRQMQRRVVIRVYSSWTGTTSSTTSSSGGNAGT